MKQIREVPLKSLAEQLRLPIHVRDTFTGWKPHNDINLIIAVSFGLFVPPRLLNSANFRGPAPLHHTLLQRCTHTGVTLQTLHHKTFDHGTVLSQTRPPGIPIPKDCTLQGLHDILTPIAANMLVDGLRRGLHLPPLKDVGWKPTEEEQEMLCHAPKLAKRDSQINWSTWSADDIVLRQRVLGSLWSMALADRERRKSMRLILENVESVKRPADVERWIQTYFERQKSGSQHKRGELDEKQAVEENQKLGIKVIDWLWHPKHTSAEDIMNAQDTRLAYFEEKDGSILIPIPKGGCLKVPTIKVEGSSSKSAAKAISSNFGFIEKD
uniref:Methionyl-trna formyltransferase n=1 Tax=Colletotrichum fructicola (strain Nara gc5) TaxID=1213859 RepID=L2G4S7_COLFN